MTRKVPGSLSEVSHYAVAIGTAPAPELIFSIGTALRCAFFLSEKRSQKNFKD